MPIHRLIPQLPPRAHRVRQSFQHVDRGVPSDARIRDADALFEARGAFGRHFLAAFVQVGFDHDADDAGFAGADLGGDGLGDEGLVAVIFLGVAWWWGELVGWGYLGGRRGKERGGGWVMRQEGGVYIPCEQSIIMTCLMPFFLHCSFVLLTLSASKFVLPPPPRRMTKP